jgi:hypothetical protein
VNSKAAKRDDAVIAVDMWDKRLLLLYPKCSSHHLSTLLTWLLVRVRRLICRGLRAHLRRSYGPSWLNLLLDFRQLLVRYRNTKLDTEDVMCHGDSEGQQGGFHQHQRLLLEVEWGAYGITRFTESTWWEWTRGLALVFWRWGDYENLAVDGCAPFLLT